MERFVTAGLGDRGLISAEYDRQDGTLRLSWSGAQVFLTRDEAIDFHEYLSDLRMEFEGSGAMANQQRHDLQLE